MSDPQAKDIYDTIRMPLVAALERAPEPSANGTQDQVMVNCLPQSTIDPLNGTKTT